MYGIYLSIRGLRSPNLKPNCTAKMKVGMDTFFHHGESRGSWAENLRRYLREAQRLLTMTLQQGVTTMKLLYYRREPKKRTGRFHRLIDRVAILHDNGGMQVPHRACALWQQTPRITIQTTAFKYLIRCITTTAFEIYSKIIIDIDLYELENSLD